VFESRIPAVPLQTRDLLDRVYADWNVGGPQAMVENYWHPDIVWHDSPSFPDTGVYHGAEATARRMNGFVDVVGHFQIARSSTRRNAAVVMSESRRSGSAATSTRPTRCWRWPRSHRPRRRRRDTSPVIARADSTQRAVAETATLEDARVAAGALEATDAPSAEAPAPALARSHPGSADPLLGELRRAGLLPLLVLHFLAAGPSYGNQLMDRVVELSGGLLAVNPNTMYPLLRSLESRGLIAGEWEHPERRSRRFYTLTAGGAAERDRLAGALEPHLAGVAAAIEQIRREVLGS
jgi:PadR family transcriptional regulator, regulatory protein PadR